MVFCYYLSVYFNCDIHDELCSTFKEVNSLKKFWIFSNSVDLDIKNMEKLIDALEDNDDVQNVYHNWEQ